MVCMTKYELLKTYAYIWLVTNQRDAGQALQLQVEETDPQADAAFYKNAKREHFLSATTTKLFEAMDWENAGGNCSFMQLNNNKGEQLQRSHIIPKGSFLRLLFFCLSFATATRVAHLIEHLLLRPLQTMLRHINNKRGKSHVFHGKNQTTTNLDFFAADLETILWRAHDNNNSKSGDVLLQEVETSLGKHKAAAGVAEFLAYHPVVVNVIPKRTPLGDGGNDPGCKFDAMAMQIAPNWFATWTMASVGYHLWLLSQRKVFDASSYSTERGKERTRAADIGLDMLVALADMWCAVNQDSAVSYHVGEGVVTVVEAKIEVPGPPKPFREVMSLSHEAFIRREKQDETKPWHCWRKTSTGQPTLALFSVNFVPTFHETLWGGLPGGLLDSIFTTLPNNDSIRIFREALVLVGKQQESKSKQSEFSSCHNKNPGEHGKCFSNTCLAETHLSLPGPAERKVEQEQEEQKNVSKQPIKTSKKAGKKKKNNNKNNTPGLTKEQNKEGDRELEKIFEEAKQAQKKAEREEAKELKKAKKEQRERMVAAAAAKKNIGAIAEKIDTKTIDEKIDVIAWIIAGAIQKMEIQERAPAKEQKMSATRERHTVPTSVYPDKFYDRLDELIVMLARVDLEEVKKTVCKGVQYLDIINARYSEGIAELLKVPMATRDKSFQCQTLTKDMEDRANNLADKL